LLKQIFWQRALIEISAIILIATIVGFICHNVMLFLMLALALLLVWNTYNLHKLSTWIWQQNALYPPNSIGSFDVISYGLHKRQKRMRQKQNELAEIIKRFRYGAESIPDSLLLTDIEGKIEWCNKIAQYQLYIRWPDDKGQNIINLIRHPQFANYMRKKNFATPLTLLFNNKNYIEFRIIPYFENHWVIIVRDVDQLYLAEQQRHDFFTNASHELRTPLTVVKGYLDMLSDDLVSADKQKQIFNTMQMQITRMESLVGQILTLSHIENNPIKNQLQLINMPEILHKIEHNICQIYPKYRFHFDVDNTLLITGHKDQLYSVVSNLIYNAIKHTPENTAIHVCWKPTSQGAFFSVTDTGQGIPTHHLHRLTERFYQVDSARTHEKDSSGLGLAIVKHALLNHANTKLEISSELGKGSRFSFTLPIQYLYSHP